MSKEVEALNYLVNLAVVGNKENNRGKVFTSEEIILQANEYIFFVRYKIVRAITHDLIGTTQEEHYFVDNGSIYRVYNGIKTLIKIHEGEDE